VGGSHEVFSAEECGVGGEKEGVPGLQGLPISTSRGVPTGLILLVGFKRVYGKKVERKDVKFSRVSCGVWVRLCELKKKVYGHAVGLQTGVKDAQSKIKGTSAV
jgi:hypothetical protein